MLRDHELLGQPIGVDIIEPAVLFALQDLGIQVVDGQQVFLEARRIKTDDEIGLLTQAASMVDSAYEALYQFLQPGVRENECVGLVAKVLYDLGSEHVEGVNAISGERCSPHPHVFSDRIIRPGDPAFFDILHSHMGYRTCYYRTFAVGSASRAQRDAYKICRSYMDRAIALVQARVPRPPTSSRCGRRRRSSASPTRRRPSPCSTATASGLSIWERPIFSRLTSIRPSRGLGGGHGLRPGDLLAGLRRLGRGPHRGGGRRHRHRCEVITKFPAEELLVAGRRYYTVGGSLPLLRDSQSHRNTEPFLSNAAAAVAAPAVAAPRPHEFAAGQSRVRTT